MQLKESTGKIVDRVLYVIFGIMVIVGVVSFLSNVIKGEIPMIPLITFIVICIGCLVLLIRRIIRKRNIK